MTDQHQDIEDLLRRYRPVEPPAVLRQRIAPVVPRPLWPWAAAAAVLLAANTAVQMASNQMVARLGTADRDVSPAIDDLAMSLGGGATAQLFAATVVANQRIDAEVSRRGGEPAGPLERGGP